MQNTIKYFSLAMLLIISNTSAATTDYEDNNYNNGITDYKEIVFVQLRLIFEGNPKEQKITEDELKARNKYIKKKAQLLGIKIATFESKKAIESILSNNEITQELDSLYPFQKLIFKQHFLPPVIDYLQNAVLKKDDNVLRSTKFVFSKVKNSKVVTSNYSWRNYFYYFLTSQDKDTKIDLDDYINSASTPLSEAELSNWLDHIEKGYQKGLGFMENSLSSYFAELNRDFKGFVLFYILQDQGLIQPIKVISDKQEYIIKDDQLRIGDELFFLNEPNFDVEKYLKRLKEMEKESGFDQ